MKFGPWLAASAPAPGPAPASTPLGAGPEYPLNTINWFAVRTATLEVKKGFESPLAEYLKFVWAAPGHEAATLPPAPAVAPVPAFPPLLPPPVPPVPVVPAAPPPPPVLPLPARPPLPTFPPVPPCPPPPLLPQPMAQIAPATVSDQTPTRPLFAETLMFASIRCHFNYETHGGHVTRTKSP